MPSNEPVKVAGNYRLGHCQQIRLNMLSGGLGGVEVVVDCSKDGTRLSVWNPYTHSWTDFSGADCGDTCKIGKTAPVVEEVVAETLDCELICPNCGCDTMLWFGHTPPRPRQTNEGER